jgi:hypothetical protein
MLFIQTDKEKKMEQYKININVDKSELTEVIKQVVDIDDIVEQVNNDIDLSDLADRVTRYLDLDDIADSVQNMLDMNDIVNEVASNIDVEDTIYDLLDRYNPGNGCSTGDKATSAISKAMIYNIQFDDAVREKLQVFIHETLNTTIALNPASDNSPAVDEVIETEPALVELKPHTVEFEYTDILAIIFNAARFGATLSDRSNDSLQEAVHFIVDKCPDNVQKKLKAFNINSKLF